MTDPIDQIREALAKAIADAIIDRQAELTAIAEAGGHAASGGLFGDVKNLTNIVSDVLGAIPLVGGVLSEATNPLKAIEDAGGKFGTGLGIGYMLGYAAWQLAEPAFLPLIHAANATLTNEVFDPQTAATLAAKGIITVNHAQEEGGGSGFDNPHMGQMVDGARTHPALAELLEMWRRKIIAESDVDYGLLRNGVDPGWNGKLKDLKEQLLSAADLALAELRGHLTHEDALAYSELLGVNATDFETVIANTGEPPGTMQMLEAYRRDFIGRDRLARGIKQSRVRDEWIDVIEKLRYSPMSTADAVRAVVQHQLPDDEGASIAQQNGLEAKDWRPLVNSYGRPLAHGEMTHLYHLGKVTQQEVEQAFFESDQKDKYAKYIFDLGRRLIPERTIVAAIHNGVVQRDEGLSMLKQLGFDEHDATVLVDVGLHERASAHKELSRAQIVSLYETHVFKKQEAIDHLVQLGFQTRDADLMLTLADSVAHTRELKAEQQHVRALFIGGHVDELGAENQLIALGIDQATAAHSISVWKRERGRATRGLSEAQVLKAVESNVLTYQQGLAQLQGLGFSQPDAVIILSSHGLKSTAA